MELLKKMGGKAMPIREEDPKIIADEVMLSKQDNEDEFWNAREEKASVGGEAAVADLSMIE